MQTDTPVYVYSAARIQHNIGRLRAAFDPLGASIHYSMKANANLALLRLIHAAGLGMDAVSAGEIFRARAGGRRSPADRVSRAWAKPATNLFMRWMWAWAGSMSRAAPNWTCSTPWLSGLDRPPRVALRLNPGIQAKTHHHIATGHFGAKFGMPPDTVTEILAHRADYPHLRIEGIHVHIGSQLGDVQETLDAVRLAQALAAPYADVRTLNIGGGFPVAYAETDEYPAPSAFAEALKPLLDGWHLMIEPGRSVMADAGVLLVSVLYVKEQAGQRFVITDGSMTDLIRPALYEAVHPVVPVCQKAEASTHPSIVVGPVCKSADVLNRGVPLRDLAAGDRLAVLGTGAYGIVMASNYNMRVRAPEVLVEGDDVACHPPPRNLGRSAALRRRAREHHHRGHRAHRGK